MSQPTAFGAGITPNALLTPDDLAARWKVPRSWVYTATRAGRIPVVRLGKHLRFRLADVEAFEEAGGCAADSESVLAADPAAKRRASGPVGPGDGPA